MSDNVVLFPEREQVMEPMETHLEIAQMMLDAADDGNIQRSWVHAVACAMTTEYRAGQDEAKAEIERLRSQIDGLSDPNVVHLNMLRGTISKPTVAQIIHLYRPEILREALGSGRLDEGEK